MSKTLLITGAGKRIGKALALALGQDGWTIAVHYNTSPNDAQAVADAITTQGGNAFTIEADLANEEDTQSLVERTVDQANAPLSALINNASIFERDQWDSVSRESWDAHLNINLRAPFILTQSFAKALTKGQSGSVINIIDQRVWKLTPDYISYTLSKAALWTLTQTLAQALAPRIRVNAIGPGPVLRSIHQDEAAFARQTASLPLAHGASPDDIVAAARYLLNAPSVTGQMIAVDGGQHLAWRTPDVLGVD